MNIIKIIQVLPTLSYGDAVSNDTINMYETLKKNGYNINFYPQPISLPFLSYQVPATISYLPVSGFNSYKIVS